MHDPIGPPTADTSAQARLPLALCPVCEAATRIGYHVHEKSGAHSIGYRCAGNHIFIVRWAEVA